MNETQLSSKQLQVTSDAPGAERPQVGGRSLGWSAGRVTAVVIGSLLVLVSLALLGGGGTGVWADLTQRDGGYVTTGTHEFSATGSALASEPTHLG